MFRSQSRPTSVQRKIQIYTYETLMDADACFCQAANRRQPRLSCVPPPTYHPQRPESHEESPSYSWYKNAYFRSFLKTDSPIGCIVTLHWLHDRAFGTLSLRENDLSSIFVRYFIHIRSGVRCEKYYGSSMFVLERPLSSACIGFH